ncbi:MAG: hypothetical protein PWQ75_511 [Methanolobus sp.]|jgi:hypothetical protein|nr:hypothetical protein [Methanolobus sp.]MDK2830759.1 hypothetical protein [Methanolobus sp.]
MTEYYVNHSPYSFGTFFLSLMIALITYYSFLSYHGVV